MLRLLVLAAGAYWLRKPENRELATRKVKEGWDNVVHGSDRRQRDVSKRNSPGHTYDEKDL
ncbi:hypothetical protein C1H69_15550 [Billgrantia endophytica]|uniref:Uncharacterized protein n=1 Tax=Billgrantia endophytica TaxID=2033802 RepID=A0A2N7TZY4_9GAMM|nr:hypothetical protein C1H69_15550 [Halomonas endophytica]